MTEPTGPAPLVSVRGEAQLEGPPDLATVALTLHASGDSPEHTRSQLAEGSAKVAQLLVQFETAVERSSTSGVHVFPVFNRRTPPKITGYQGTFATQIVVADLESLSPLVLALTGLPDSQVDGPWWSLRHDNAMYRRRDWPPSPTLAGAPTTTQRLSGPQWLIWWRSLISTPALAAYARCVRSPWGRGRRTPRSSSNRLRRLSRAR
jgi:hypothetical protein